MAEGRWRVMVVDDEADLRELIRLTLEFDDRLEVVFTVPTLEAAMAAAENGHIDLVVLDHWLGGALTGLDAAGRLKTTVPGARILLFTAADGVGAEGSNVDAVLMKSELVDLPRVVIDLLDH
jgi:two-component system response regulator DesR